MTTKAQVKLATRQLLDHNHDLELVGRLAAIKPVNHVLRGVYFDRNSDVESLRLVYGVVFLFEPDAQFSFNWCRDIYRPRPGVWNIHDPSLQSMLREEVERIALPSLRPVCSLDDFVDYVSEANFPSTPLTFYKIRNIFVEVARGNLAGAIALCDYFTSDRAQRYYGGFMQEELDFVRKRLCPLIRADDRAGLVAFLHELEEAAVRKLKLEHLWQRTPFPLEERGWT